MNAFDILLKSIGNFLREFGTPLFVFIVCCAFVFIILRIIQSERDNQHKREEFERKTKAAAEETARLAAAAAEKREEELVNKLTGQLQDRLNERDAIFELYKSEAEHKIKSLQIRVEQAVSEAKEAKQLLSAEKLHSEELETVNRKLQDVNENLVQTNRNLIQENQTLMAKFADMEARLSAMEALETRLKTLEDELGRKEREIQELRAKVAAAEISIEAVTLPPLAADSAPSAGSENAA